VSHLESPVVAVRNVDLFFDDKQIFDGLNLEIRASGLSVIMGPSGCGKSTLLALIGGRMAPHGGTVDVFGNPVNLEDRRKLYGMRRRMGMMFQSNALLTDLNVFENVAFPIRENTDLPESLIRKLVLLKLEQVGLRGTQALMPSELSGGMSRRVALARATALDPELLLYDEPFTGLDPISMGAIVKLVHELNETLSATSIIVTHDVEEGLSVADYVHILGNRSVLASGTPDELLKSEQEEVKQFLHGQPDGPVPFHYPAKDYQDEMIGQA